MKEFKQSIRQSLYRSHPRAYFLIGSVMHRASDRDWEAMTERVEIADEDRLDRVIKQHILRADVQRMGGWEQGRIEFNARYRSQHRFRFYGYQQVNADVAPTIFVCPACKSVKSLSQQLERGNIAKRDVTCHNCGIPLRQIVHVFGHERCGEVVEIQPQRCSECGSAMRLYIDNANLWNSEWRCLQGHSKELVAWCPKCTDLGVEPRERRMRPYAAGAVVRPVSLKMVDIRADADWEDVARNRLELAESSPRDVILNYYEEQTGGDPLIMQSIRQRLDSDEATRRQMYEDFRAAHPELRNSRDTLLAAIGDEPPTETQQILAEYRGIEQAIEKGEERLRRVHGNPNPLDPNLQALIQRDFHVVPRYVSNLPIVEVIYGYQVGTSDASRAMIRTFDYGWESKALVYRMTTEAALFDLDSNRVAKWASQQTGNQFDSARLYRTLLAPQERDPEAGRIQQLVQSLLHTLAHQLIRQSELFTGLSRDSLSEIIFVPALSFALFCSQGSEQGALRSTFASHRLYDWFNQAYYASGECAHDPSCSMGQITGTASCHACLHIAERNCNGYWNESLDRRLLTNVENRYGFWD